MRLPAVRARFTVNVRIDRSSVLPRLVVMLRAERHNVQVVVKVNAGSKTVLSAQVVSSTS